MKKLFAFGLLAAACLGYSQNLVLNPGFETGDMTNWTVIQAGLNSGVDKGGGNAHGGSHYYGLGAPTSDNSTDFFQTIALTVGDTYTASYWAYDQANPSKGFLSVDINGSVIGPINGSVNPLAYQQYVMTFTAAVATTKLEVTGNGSAGGKFVIIDDLSVVDNTAAPEPASCLALGVGASLVAWRRRKR